MQLPIYSRVALIVDHYTSDGVARGDTGFIVEIYENGDYEVDFVRSDGTTIAIFSVHPEEVMPSDPLINQRSS